MTDESTSLDRLHDIVPPPDIPWWPPAAGWYAVLLVVAVLLLRTAWKTWQSWRQNAWRREALQELRTAGSVAAVAAVLRRCGLVMESRARIAALNGSEWVDWIERQTDAAVPDSIRRLLLHDVYGRGSSSASPLPALKQFATAWIHALKPGPRF